jgi:uncharacterized protein
MSSSIPAFHVMAKPIGPLCNLDCKYCFYLEKQKLFPSNEHFKITEEVLEAYVRQYIQQQNVPEITFAWQGGEPTLLGIDFFRKAVALQRQYSNGKRVNNALQTNGTLLNDEWCEFLAKNQFLVGLSVDGSPKLHDTYRVDKNGAPTYERVAHGLKFLKKHGVEFNTLTVVNRANSRKPLEVYRFLKQIGSGFIQFIPLVERLADDEAKRLGLNLATPPRVDQEGEVRLPVTEWSLEPKAYGEFLVAIFDEWVREDVGKVFVQLFDVTLGNTMGIGPGLCMFSPTCGTAVAMEHNGDIYSCDHYVYPHYKLGNVLNQTLGEMVGSEFQRTFGQNKSDSLPKYCRECEVRFACHGECPKHRFLRTPDGEAGLNYLCAAYKRFFTHSVPAMQRMASLLRAGRPAADIMMRRK